jgi:hypothetical protein
MHQGRSWRHRAFERGNATLGPYGPQSIALLYIVLLLFADAHVSLVRQDLLGLTTLAVLLLLLRCSPAKERRQIWILIAIATCFELDCSVLWGLYRYRLGNLPLYVPPGHGLVYLFALSFVRTPIMRRHSIAMRRLTLCLASAWAVAGLTISPWLAHRPDVWGALCLPVLAWFLTTRTGDIYVGTFLITSVLELVGTGLGNWTWVSSAPVLGIPIGNPPSAIAAGYCLMDLLASRLSMPHVSLPAPTNLTELTSRSAWAPP